MLKGNPARRQAPAPAPEPVEEDPEDAAADETPPMQLLDTEAGDGVHLEEWAKQFVCGEAIYAWPDVKAAIMDRFSKDVTNEDDAIDFLISEKVVSPADLKAAQEAGAA